MQQKVLIIGAGKSSVVLIKELAELSEVNLIVADRNPSLLQELPDENITKLNLDIDCEEPLVSAITSVDIVISMLPARFHYRVAVQCALIGKHFLCASYTTPELENLAEEFVKKDKILITEMGLDPGIDHMSAKCLIDNLQDDGYEIIGFETFTGGLIGFPFEKQNPWKYKFTWNPRNVVLAGQGHVKFIQEGKYKYIPYHKIFKRTEIIDIPDVGLFEGYPNRDSLKYIEKYGLNKVKTFYRGTLRRPGFSRAWDCLIQLGVTDDSYVINSKDMSHREFINQFLFYHPNDSVELKMAHYLHLDLHGEEMHKLKWAGLFSEEKIGMDKGTPAQLLELILKKKWTMAESEYDMVVMWHQLEAVKQGKQKVFKSYMIQEGENARFSAMAHTVGLPLAISTKLILNGEMKGLKGLLLPYQKAIYNKVLPLLKKAGIKFVDI